MRSTGLIDCFAGGAHLISYAWTTCRSPTTIPNDYGTIAVIDGCTLKLTPLRIANIPPPMAFKEIQLEDPIVDVVFSENRTGPVRFAVLLPQSILVYDWAMDILPAKTPKLVGSCRKLANMCQIPSLQVQQACLTDILLVSGCSLHGSVLIQFDLLIPTSNLDSAPQTPGTTDPHAGTDALKSVRVLQNSLFIKQLLSTPPKSIFLWQNDDTVVEYRGLGEATPDAGSPNPIMLPPKPESVTVIQAPSSSNQVAIALSRAGTLYAGSRILAKDCTSYITTATHLIWTTQQVTRILQLEELNAPADERSIERGARIVTACPSTFAIVLQMPRGNLETIYPRTLVLAGIRQNLDSRDYAQAFFACRSHRVELDILHNHNPDSFFEDVDLFIDQLHQKQEHIDLFLSHIKDARKVNHICDKFLTVLRGKSLVQSSITAHVCKIPPDLESGLKEVSRLQVPEPTSVKAAVEHICFLVDVNKLYDTALGLYNLDLALLVAEKSQMDPREYLPFLQGLHAQPQLRRQFNIDDGLGRHGKALDHLAGLNAFEELKAYVAKHVLYEEALELYKYDEGRFRDITLLHAQHLSLKNRHKEAGLAYEYLGHYQIASDAYRLAHLWREALSCAALLDQAQLRPLASSIADSLVELKDYNAAAIVTLDYLKDAEEAARLYCKASNFSEAIRIATQNSALEPLEMAKTAQENGSRLPDIVDSCLIESQGATTEMLADCRGQLHAQMSRIKELRDKKSQNPAAFFGGDASGADIPDNVSLAATDMSTMASLFTRYTNVSAKSKRREERKRAAGKRGTVYEEEYLVNSVRRLVDRVKSEDVQDLVQCLFRRGMRERSRAVQEALVATTKLCEESVKEVLSEVEDAEVVPNGTNHT